MPRSSFPQRAVWPKLLPAFSYWSGVLGVLSFVISVIVIGVPDLSWWAKAGIILVVFVVAIFGFTILKIVSTIYQRVKQYDLLYDGLKLADHYGKIRLIMLHKLKFAGGSACSTPITCDAGLIRAIDPGIGACSLVPFLTRSVPMNHFVAVTDELLSHIVALLPIFWQRKRRQCKFWNSVGVPLLW
jgi:hypothetical protein